MSLIHADARAIPLRDACVQCVVTSPPYFGLRDYGIAGQIGLEQTPDAYVAQIVAVFREVRRALKDDGVCWLNLGDSYAGGGGGNYGNKIAPDHGQHITNVRNRSTWLTAAGLKSKDLLGIPWSVAKALQAPYYAGRVAEERHRAWMAATIDAEGSICGFLHERKDDGRIRTGIHITITNSSTLMLDEAHRIWPASRSEHERPGDGHLGTMQTYRWIVHGIPNKIDFLREIYPYLIVKRGQAVIAYNMLLLMADAKRLGRSIQGDAVRARRADLMARLSRANHGAVDVPDWCVEPPSLSTPGWYLRSDVIWSKPNPMPESVTDRPTRAHEYLFLLTKSADYFYDADAIKETAVMKPQRRLTPRSANPGTKFSHQPSHRRPEGGTNPRDRNKRSVWTVNTKPYAEAHFATMPEALVEPCVLGGSRPGDVVFDPFIGSGTVAAVAERLGRRWVGSDLNPAYQPLAKKRTAQRGFKFHL